MALERGLDDSALNATTAAVDETHRAEPRVRRRVHVLFHNGADVGWREGVEIDLCFDWDADRHRLGVAAGACRYSAVTVVLIPPRTEKSPTTVMRRGRMAPTRSSRIWL